MTTDYWQRIDEANRRLINASTVDDVIDICNDRFHRERALSGVADGDAFYPGGADTGLYDVLVDAGWSFLWINASFHFCARDSRGARLTFVEGDIHRGERP